MYYAVSVTDLTAYTNDIAVQMLIAPVIDRQHVFNPEPGQQTEAAVMLNCETARASAIVQFVRRKYRRDQLRFYQSATGNGGWKRV